MSNQIVRTIADMQELAERKKGKCLSEMYINTKTKLLWECAKGHQWEATPQQIKIGRWCPVCAKARIRRWWNYERPH